MDKSVISAKSVSSGEDSSVGTTADAGVFSPMDSLSPVSSAPDSLSAVNDPSNPIRSDPSDSTVGFSGATRVAAENIPKTPKQGRSRAQPTEKSGFTGKVDLNRAPVTELTKVKGIGEKTALAIVEYRSAHGPFRDLRELLQVKGIGEKKLEKLGPYLIL